MRPSRALARALRILGSSLDPRIRAALVASTPPRRVTVRHYLGLAACLAEALSHMPGVLHLAAPAERLAAAVGFLTETERLLLKVDRLPAEAPVPPRTVSSLSLGLNTSWALCEALEGLPEGSPLRGQLDGALRRWRAVCAAYQAILDRKPRAPGGAPPAATAPRSLVPFGRRQPPRRRSSRLSRVWLTSRVTGDAGPGVVRSRAGVR